jgi:uncharacterized membrane-anchored protein YhcB (DUF1043 family)
VQYRAVYEHLAEGAQALCPEAFQALRSSLEAPALERGDEGVAPAQEDVRAAAENAPA